jgi:hypothetical protein
MYYMVWQAVQVPVEKEDVCGISRGLVEEYATAITATSAAAMASASRGITRRLRAGRPLCTRAQSSTGAFTCDI